MEVTFTVVYHELVVREDIPGLSKPMRERVRTAIEEKLTTRPQDYGRPLRRSLKGYRRLRVGDYRVVFRIDGSTVRVLAILHRSVVYTEAGRR